MFLNILLYYFIYYLFYFILFIYFFFFIFIFIFISFRTYNKGTAYDFFSEYFSSFGLKCSETKDLNEALKALEKPATLVVASVGPGYWTQTGHYILLYAHDKSFVYARDPLHPNRHKTSQETLKKEGIIYFIVSQ